MQVKIKTKQKRIKASVINLKNSNDFLEHLIDNLTDKNLSKVDHMSSYVPPKEAVFYSNGRANSFWFG